MLNTQQQKRSILEQVQKKLLSPEEGARLLRQLSTGSQKSSNKVKSSDIAVIGMSGRFPEAHNIEQFWSNLSQGRDSVKLIPEERWAIESFYDEDPLAPMKSYSKWGGFLDEIDRFDPLFFKISPREAELMDPQQRLFLEEAWKAIEHAGYSPDSLSGSRFGVFAGMIPNWYEQNLKKSGKYNMDSNFLTGSGSAYLPARISYLLNLTGPNMSIDTACSSSLVAIHQACQSLRNEECDMALVGGVSIIMSPDFYIMTSKGGMLSKTGRCRTFDNTADGFVPGEAVCAVVLKKLSKAIQDRDHIMGVIKGTGINQDGSSNGFTAPNGKAQSALMKDIYSKYDIHPEQISYVEAHGTGTKLGDPIEVAALTRTFREYTDKTQFCALGSVKTNIGHTLAAAGIAGFIKILLCLQHKMLVPSLHYQTENEHLNMRNSPFYVNTHLTEWKVAENTPRIAAMSSFGLSGTNSHLVIEEAPELFDEDYLLQV